MDNERCKSCYYWNDCRIARRSECTDYFPITEESEDAQNEELIENNRYEYWEAWWSYRYSGLMEE